MEHQLLIGKFTLESLTSGLYVSPLDLYREYVQNAADSIDEALEQGILKKGEEKISITVSESERIIKISDNGTGVGANDIYSNLIDIGNSKKRHSNSRGFRGIGRLSGLGYCQKLKFLTSIHGEEKASCIIYDAEKLKYLLSPQVDSRDSIDQVLSSVLTIEEIPERINKHYFSVELYGVVPESDLLNDSEVVPYLQQNLPVPFSRDFVWGSMIKQKLVQMEVELAEYNVELRTDRRVFYILLNRPINIYPGIGGVIDMELEECIKDNFDESLRVYIQSQEYTRLKQQEDRLLSYLQAGLSDMQKQQLGAYMDATTEVHSALASQDYVNGVVDGIALREKVTAK